MGDQQRREPVDPAPLELPGDVGRGRAGVDQDRIAPGGLQQDRVALADVEELDPQPGRCRVVARARLGTAAPAVAQASAAARIAAATSARRARRRAPRRWRRRDQRSASASAVASVT